ncbi:OmpH family outer membrane protein [Herbaspirillum sp. RU 5E]|uniref:Outer membrane protein chaperone n=2 Tax=Oxalobacteraceae TaxID=75682 RepID=A0A225SZA3_9BURK|nr:OmpH family outer membrane protein [Herbaspirillum sp. RU 5E]MRT29053.1 OmpH family outer membrane protein [Herbaspirillum sp. CAH-3]OWY36325.1 outer membrane protein chaperone [Herbaspirillum aquaticum]
MKFMTKSFLSLQTVVMAACLLSFAPAHAQESSKIAFVSTERIFREAAPAKAAQTKLEAEFAKRDRDLQDMAARLKAQSDKLDKDAAVLSDSDRAKRQRDLSDLDKEFQRKQREFREDLNQRRNEELSVVLERTNKVIRQIAEAEKYDIVFQEAVYASKRIDITDKVLKELAK